MSVQDKRRQSVPRSYEGLVPLELAVDLMIGSSEVVMIDEGTNPSHRVCARGIAPDPPGPELALSRLLQGVEAAEARQEHHEGTSDHSASGNPRLLAAVPDCIEDARKSDDLPGVRHNPTKDGYYFSLLRSFSR